VTGEGCFVAVEGPLRQIPWNGKLSDFLSKLAETASGVEERGRTSKASC
jgi:hypothetical protein